MKTNQPITQPKTKRNKKKQIINKNNNKNPQNKHTNKRIDEVGKKKDTPREQLFYYMTAPESFI